MISFLAILCVWPLSDSLEPCPLEGWLEHVGAVLEPGVVERALLETKARLFDPDAQIFDSVEEKEESERKWKQPAEWKDLGEGLVYLKPGWFDETLGGLVSSALTHSAQTGGAGVILDGRGGDGERIEGVEFVVSHFVEADVFLYVLQDFGGGVLDFRSARRSDSAPVPLIYLVDEKTRGVAELLAALLAEKKRALVIGQPTAGDGVIRAVLPLPGGRFIRMAVAGWATPDGRSVRGKSVLPHIRVEREEWKRPDFRPEAMVKRGQTLDEETRRHLEVFTETRQDAALARAVDILLGLKSMSGRPIPLP